MEELVKLLKQRWGFCPGPVGSDTNWLTIHWYYAFEPHGRASEDWEEAWRVTLPGIRAHWRHARDGWVPCKGNGPAHFEARDLRTAIGRAKAFLNEANPNAERAKF